MNKQFSSNFRIGGKIATMYFERGLTYNQLQVILSAANGLTKDLIAEIRLKLNDKTIWQIDPRRMNIIDAYHVGGVDRTHAEIINLDFTEPDAKNAGSEFAGIIGTAPLGRWSVPDREALFPNALGVDVNNFSLEIEAVDHTVPLNYLQLQYWISSPSPLARRIATLLPRTIYFAGAGVHDLELPFGPKSAHDIRRVWLFEDKIASDPDGAPTVLDLDPKRISKVTVRKNSVDNLETIRFTNEYDQKRYRGITGDEFYCVDMGMANYNVQELLLTQDATDCRLKVTTTGATNVTYWIEAYSDLSLL